MKEFFAVAPGAIWSALIVGLMLLAEWLTTYFGAVAWVAPVAGLLAAVIVPILKVFAENKAQAALPSTQERYVWPQPKARSTLAKWLL